MAITACCSEMNLFDINEDALYWLRWRREDGIRQGRAFRQAIDELPRQLLLGNGPRSAVFSGMTALDFHAWGQIVDLLLVKHYFWHRGFDGCTAQLPAGCSRFRSGIRY